MNEANQLTVTLTQITHDASGKAQTHKRRFANINPAATHDQIKSFAKIIENLTGETFDQIEVTKNYTLL